MGGSSAPTSAPGGKGGSPGLNPYQIQQANFMQQQQTENIQQQYNRLGLGGSTMEKEAGIGPAMASSELLNQDYMQNQELALQQEQLSSNAFGNLASAFGSAAV